jgi:membrane protease subunit (stomatin/prohibitin family)
MIMATKLGAIDLQGHQVELSDKLREFVQERVDDEFGLKVESVTMNITLPEEITQAMTRGVARGVEHARYLDNVGPMDRLQQGAAAEAMVEAARNPGGEAAP